MWERHEFGRGRYAGGFMVSVYYEGVKVTLNRLAYHSNPLSIHLVLSCLRPPSLFRFLIFFLPPALSPFPFLCNGQVIPPVMGQGQISISGWHLFYSHTHQQVKIICAFLPVRLSSSQIPGVRSVTNAGNESPPFDGSAPVLPVLPRFCRPRRFIRQPAICYRYKR